MSNEIVEAVIVKSEIDFDEQQASEWNSNEDFQQYYESLGLQNESKGDSPIPAEDASNTKTKTSTGKRSCVRKYFQYDETESRCVCKICSKNLNGKYVSNLLKHLKSVHTQIFDEIRHKLVTKSVVKKEKPINYSQQISTLNIAETIASVYGSLEKTTTKFPTSRKLEKNATKHKNARQKLALLFAANSIPNSTVETPEFVEFCKELDNQFEVPASLTLTSDIVDLVGEIRNSTERILNDAKQMTIVLDIWRPVANKSFLAVKVNFYDFQINQGRDAFLAFQQLPPSYTTEILHAIFCKVLAAWNIPTNKIRFFVTNSSYGTEQILRRLIEKFKGKFDCLLNCDKSSETHNESVTINLEHFETSEKMHNCVFGPDKRIPSVAHRLLFTFLRNFERYEQQFLDLVRSIGYYLTSTGEIIDAQINDNCYNQISWMDVCCNFKRICCELKTGNNISVDANSSQLKEMEEVVSAIRLFADAFLELETTTLPNVIPLLYNLIHSLNDDFVSPDFASVKRNIREDLEKSFSYILNPDNEDFRPIFTVATFLEPKFLPGLSDMQIKVAKTEIVRSLAEKIQTNTVVSETTESLTNEDVSKFSELHQNHVQMYVEEAKRLTFVRGANETVSAFVFWNNQRDGLLQDIAELSLQICVIPANCIGFERSVTISDGALLNCKPDLNSAAIEKEFFVKMNRQFLSR